MSFKSILSNVEKGVGIAAKDAQVVAPLISAVYPPAGAIVNVASSLIMSAEALLPDTTTANQDKKTNVMAGLNNALPLLQAGLSLAGINFAPTPELSATISKTVDDIVTLFNDMAEITKLIEAAKAVPAPKVTPVVA